MRFRSIQHLSFVLALLLGQLLAVAHGFEHRALSTEATCQLCLHAQGLDSAATAPGAMAVAFVASVERPIAAPTRRCVAPQICYFNARAPPSSLV